MKPTRDEILAEPAGPRLNQWVAEHVTHWQPSGLARDMNGNPFPEPMPDYSGEIGAAWEVAEEIGGVVIEQWNDEWAVYFAYEDGGNSEQVTAATAPEAICKAVLLVR